MRRSACAAKKVVKVQASGEGAGVARGDESQGDAPSSSPFPQDEESAGAQGFAHEGDGVQGVVGSGLQGDEGSGLSRQQARAVALARAKDRRRGR